MTVVVGRENLDLSRRIRSCSDKEYFSLEDLTSFDRRARGCVGEGGKRKQGGKMVKRFMSGDRRS